MRITASPLFNALAKGASKRIKYSIKIRQVTSPVESLTLDNWTDISHLIHGKSFPSISHRIEYEVGQFSSDKITLESDDIKKWKSILLATHPFTLDQDVFESPTAVLG